MAMRQGTMLMGVILAFLLTIASQCSGKVSYSNSLYSIAKKVRGMKIEPLHVTNAQPGVSNRMGKIAYRSAVISMMTHLDRGDKASALKTLNEAISSLLLFDTTQSFGLPILGSVMDKLSSKYETQFPKTINGLKNYQRLLFDAVGNQRAILEGEDLTLKSGEVGEALSEVENQFATDFGVEVNQFLKDAEGSDDLLKALSELKAWTRAKKWGTMLVGPLFSAASLAFNLRQLMAGIADADEVSISSSVVGVVGAVGGPRSFVSASLRRRGGTMGPEGSVLSCILTLAGLAVDVINGYDASQKIMEQFSAYQNLTKTTTAMLEVHYSWLKRAAENQVEAGFSRLYEAHQGMLIQSLIQKQLQSIRGQPEYVKERLSFSPSEDQTNNEVIQVGDPRIFNVNFYSAWLFKPGNAQETGYNFYGRIVVPYEEGGITVRINTDLVKNFWINGIQIHTFEKDRESEPRHDNVEVGDFRGIEGFRSKQIAIETGAGDDIVLISGVIGNQALVEATTGMCIIIKMGLGHDVISFEGMPSKGDLLAWRKKSGELSDVRHLVGIKFDLVRQKLMHRVRGSNGSITDIKVGETDGVEGVIGSPLNDIIVFDDTKEWTIKESSGDNQYELLITGSLEINPVRIAIEDNSDVSGKLRVLKEGLGLGSIAYMRATNTLLIFHQLKEGLQVIEILLKRSKAGLENFSVQLNRLPTKSLADIGTFGQESGVLLPYVPCLYKFDTNLVSNVVAMTYIELKSPNISYPNEVVRYSIKSLSPFTYYTLSYDLLSLLQQAGDTQAQLTLEREGSPLSDGDWILKLQKENFGGWEVNLGRTGLFAVAIPGYEELLIDLECQDRGKFDVYNEFITSMTMKEFDFQDDYVGDDDAEKIRLKEPGYKRDSVKELTLDMRGPQNASETHRNELVIPWQLMMNLFSNDIRLGIDYHLERENMNAEWHLKVYSPWGQRAMLYDVTLLGVHALICDEKFYHWLEVLDLSDSKELQHDLRQLLHPIYWQHHGE